MHKQFGAQVPTTSPLVFADVNTVIPNDGGLLALKHFFDQRVVKEPSSETLLLGLAELAFTISCFTFSDTFYKQTNGEAMGTKMGPSCANPFAGFIEHQFFNQYNGTRCTKNRSVRKNA